MTVWEECNKNVNIGSSWLTIVNTGSQLFIKVITVVVFTGVITTMLPTIVPTIGGFQSSLVVPTIVPNGF